MMGSRDRLVRAPIFLNCLSRGGSNIFWNLFLSHPDCCSPIRETLEIFRADWRAPTRAGFRVAWLARQPRLFNQWHLARRRPFTAAAARFIDHTLHHAKLSTLDDEEMRYKGPEEIYSRDEVEAARLVAKNNNGLVFLTEDLHQLYSDATFFALVRHPLALFESHKRRRIRPRPEAFARFYSTIVEKMLADVAGFERAFLVRFEDVLADPLAMVEGLYRDAGLDLERLSGLRFKSKNHYRGDGSRGTTFEKGRHHWFELEEARRFLEPRINTLQADRLDADERRRVLDGTAAVRERLGYGEEG